MIHEHVSPGVGARATGTLRAVAEVAPGPQRSFTAHELDAVSQAFKLPVLWFLLPPAPEECAGRPLPRGWVRRLLWSDSDELYDRVEALAARRRTATIPAAVEAAEDAVAHALEDHRAHQLRRLARQLRDVAGALGAAGRRGARGRR